MAALPRELASPSKTLMGLAGSISDRPQLPILDLGCGFGRNALALAMRGLSVVCVDCDRRRLEVIARSAPQYMAALREPGELQGHLYPVCANLSATSWPFGQHCFSTIVCIHFVRLDLIPFFSTALASHGRLYFETFGGHGANYLDLPKAGEIRERLSEDFDFSLYRERKVGPKGHNSVAVTVFAQKKI